MRVARLALLALALTALAPAALAHEEFFFANLTGLDESPSNGSPGVGTAFITLDLDLVTMRVEVSFSGLTAATSAAHLHATTSVAGSGTAGVSTELAGFPLGAFGGTYDNTFDMALASSYDPAFLAANGGTVSGALNATIFALEQNKAYINLHTSAFPGGEIRGFLTPVIATPEPGTLALIALGAGLLLLRRRTTPIPR